MSIGGPHEVLPPHGAVHHEDVRRMAQANTYDKFALGFRPPAGQAHGRAHGRERRHRDPLPRRR